MARRPSKPRQRNYAKEYQARRKRYKGLPSAVALGHGEVPARIAAKAETRTLSAEERTKYRAQLQRYERHYGPAPGANRRSPRKRPGTRHFLPERFDSPQDAFEFVENEYNVSGEYVRLSKVGNVWKASLVR